MRRGAACGPTNCCRTPVDARDGSGHTATRRRDGAKSARPVELCIDPLEPAPVKRGAHESASAGIQSLKVSSDRRRGSRLWPCASCHEAAVHPCSFANSVVVASSTIPPACGATGRAGVPQRASQRRRCADRRRHIWAHSVGSVRREMWDCNREPLTVCHVHGL